MAIGLVAVFAIVIVLVATTATSTAGCGWCHRPQANALTKSVHERVACGSCHAASPVRLQASVDVVARMVPASLGGIKLDGPGRPMASSACTHCHDSVMAGEVVQARGIRIKHESCASGAPCATCHSAASHGRSTRVVRAPSMSGCTKCHLERGISTDCDVCHEGKMSADRVRDPAWVRVHGPDWKSDHGLGDQSTCAVCHSQDDCGRCHGPGVPHPGDFGSTHGDYAIESGQDKCLTCHKTGAFCEGCHTIEMPHPDGFLQQHSSIATFNEDPACTVCHPLEDCRSCHTYHIHPGGTKPPVGRDGGGA